MKTPKPPHETYPTPGQLLVRALTDAISSLMQVSFEHGFAEYAKPLVSKLAETVAAMGATLSVTAARRGIP